VLMRSRRGWIMREIEFAALDSADLIVDAIYKGGTSHILAVLRHRTPA
jgi:hypothetical protein